MRTTIMQDNLGRAVGRMASHAVAAGWMESPRGHGHIRRADPSVARAARENERRTGDKLPLLAHPCRTFHACSECDYVLGTKEEYCPQHPEATIQTLHEGDPYK